MNKSKVIFGIIIILMFLYATNPSKADFVEFSKTEIREEIISEGITSNSFIDQIIGSIAGNMKGTATDIIYERENYGIFSVYIISGDAFDYSYIGIANTFLKNNPPNQSSNINELFPDSKNIIFDEDHLNEDEYMIYSFDLKLQSELDVTINSKNNQSFEVMVFDEFNYYKYKNYLEGNDSGNIKVIEQYEILKNENLEDNLTIDKGKYFIIVDNTDKGAIHPPMNLEDDIISYKIEINGN